MNHPAPTRRGFVRRAAGIAAMTGMAPLLEAAGEGTGLLFRISLAEWSLHRTFQIGRLDNLAFPALAREEFGIEAVEYVNSFFGDKVGNRRYLKELKQRCEDAGVKSLLIMIDSEGDLGAADEGQRAEAVENHHKWVEAAQFLGCHSVRVNAASEGSPKKQMERASDGLRRLCEFADRHQINVLVENHGGLSSNGEWLAAVMKKVNHPRIGTLPDFGNFRVNDQAWYDRYKGVAELMPFAKAVSAKSVQFDEHGNETRTDYLKMMNIVIDAGYRGYVGIEWEGDGISEFEGIRRTKKLLERVRVQLEAG